MAETRESDSDQEALAGPLRRRSTYALASERDVSLYTQALKLATGNGKSISAEDKASLAIFKDEHRISLSQHATAV